MNRVLRYPAATAEAGARRLGGGGEGGGGEGGGGAGGGTPGAGGAVGLDGLEFSWNHDEFGALKLRAPLARTAPRIGDVLRLHSLTEIPYGVYGEGRGGVSEAFRADALPEADPSPLRKVVTRAEARAFRDWFGSLAPRDRRRAAFVAHFQWFDSKSKEATDEIPPTDLKEVEALLAEYFPPRGEVVW